MIPFNFETRLHAPVKIIRLLEGRIEASYCDLEILLTVDNKDNADEAKARLKAIKMWLESFLDGCIAYNARTDLDTNILTEVSNHIMMVPAEPHDHTLLMLIHTKVSSIGGDHVLILDTSFSSDTSEGFSCSLAGPAGDCLPSMEEWIGERHFHKSPWWYREDSSMIDLTPNDEDDLTVLPNLGDDLIALAKSENDEVADDSQIERIPAEIIKPVFKPRIITNDSP